MDIMNIVYPILSIGGLGVVFGAGLGIAGEVFKVDEDPKIGQILKYCPALTAVAVASPVVVVVLLQSLLVLLPLTLALLAALL